MAPEYALFGEVSPKIDVFSFGVLVLEIITEKRNASSDDLDKETNLLTDVSSIFILTKTGYLKLLETLQNDGQHVTGVELLDQGIPIATG